MQSGTILKLQEQVKLLEKKATKQPMVFHDKQFIYIKHNFYCFLLHLLGKSVIPVNFRKDTQK